MEEVFIKNIIRMNSILFAVHLQIGVFWQDTPWAIQYYIKRVEAVAKWGDRQPGKTCYFSNKGVCL